MELATLTVIVGTAFVQSIFGVGVLLFGTPLLMLLGNDFVPTVATLLPVSLTINLIQIAKDGRRADWTLFQQVLSYAIPLVVAGLLWASTASIDVGAIVGLFLLLVAAREVWPWLNLVQRRMVRYRRPYLMAMGLLHGLTNLGGSLLTALVHAARYEKRTARATVALAYATFAVFQLVTLLVTSNPPNLALNGGGGYVVAGAAVFGMTERLVFGGITNVRYARTFALFLSASGLLLFARSF